MALSPNIDLYTRLSLFLKRLIQQFEAQKALILKQAATFRAFSFRLGPSMDALAVQACLNHTQRMVSGSSNGKVFRALGCLENNGPQHEQLFFISDLLLTSVFNVDTNQLNIAARSTQAPTLVSFAFFSSIEKTHYIFSLFSSHLRTFSQ